MKDIIRNLSIAVLALFLSGLTGKADDRELLSDNYPRAGYFRVAEFTIRNMYSGKDDMYWEWKDKFSDLSGIMGKTEYEELLRDNPHEQIYNWFKWFKKDYPEKTVMVHMNGRGRIPNYRIEEFSPGHWLYFEGSDVKTDLPAQGSGKFSKETWITVDRPENFRMDNGAKFKNPDDITLVRRNSDGSFDWEHAEYVRLVQIDGNRLKISRAMFGSKGLAFEAGTYYAAPHIMGGPWEKTYNMVWYYNLSTCCPKDAKGRTCSDILVEEYSANFAKKGRWATFDGVEFDVMMSIPTTGYHEKRKALGHRADVNMDGVSDNGVIDGVDVFGLGSFDYVNRLRAAVGDKKIIAADGRENGCQKSGNHVLNGVEMEGVPEQRPFGFVTWSTTYNLLNLWKGLGMEPLFNYSAVRYNTPEKLTVEETCQYFRLALAQSVFTDSFVLLGSWPEGDKIPDLRTVLGLKNKEPLTGWLGKPSGEVSYLGKPEAVYKNDGLKEKIDCFSSSMEESEGKITLSPLADSTSFGLKIKDVPYDKHQICLEFTAKSLGVSELYPVGYNRAMSIEVEGVPQRYMIMLGTLTDSPFRYRFYFTDCYDYLNDKEYGFDPDGDGKVTLVLRIKDVDRPVELSDIVLQDAPEVIRRDFEKGTVVANLSSEPFSCVELGVTVPSKDAIFIKHEK